MPKKKDIHGTFEEELIDRDIAEKYLSRNVRNRTLNRRDVRLYADVMKRGDWDECTGQTIKFDSDGNLIDGQHRLAAVVEADVLLVFHVYRGASEDAQMHIDVGRKRSASDTLSMDGYRNATALAASLKTYLWIRDHCVGNTFNYTIDEVIACLEDHPGISEVVDYAVNLRSHFKGSAGAIAVGIYLLRQAGGDTSEFENQLMYGTNLQVGSPVLALRTRLSLMDTGMGGNRAANSKKQVLQLLIRAWNAYAKGKTITRLQYDPNVLVPKIEVRRVYRSDQEEDIK